MTNDKVPITKEDPPNSMAGQTTDISWIDEFVSKIKPYIYVREVDKLLILIPNQAHRLNASGFAILDFLLKGNTVHRLLDLVGDTETKRREIHYFFCDLRSMVTGCMRDDEKREAVTYYEFTGDINGYPVLSEIAVTYRCNLNCEFCYVGRRDCRELATSDLKKVLFKIYNEARVPSVSFTGGEPLLRKDIFDLVRYASKIGLWTNLITNGTMLNEVVVNELKQSGLSSVQVSIEGPDQELHDAVTGHRGSFEATIRGISNLLAAEIPVHTNTTVSRTNIKHLDRILLLAKSIGLTRLSMNLLIPCGAASSRKELWVPYEEIGDTVLRLKDLAGRESMKFLWYSPVPMCFFNSVAHGLGNKSCAAVTGLLSIDPMGNVLPCSSWREPVGSLLKRSFKSIWESPMLAYFKKADYAPAECKTCHEFAICKGACPLYWKVNDSASVIPPAAAP